MSCPGGAGCHCRSQRSHVRFHVPYASGDICNGAGWVGLPDVVAAVDPNRSAWISNDWQWVGCFFGGADRSAGSPSGDDVDWYVIGLHAGFDVCAGFKISASQYNVGGFTAGTAANSTAPEYTGSHDTTTGERKCAG